jgi:3-deoxy-D-manno-octulosonic-acid transferase
MTLFPLIQVFLQHKMQFLYRVGIHFYFLAIRIAALFKPKARQWIEGRKNIFQDLATRFKDNQVPVIWLHAASLGEFEQGRPVIEELRIRNYEFGNTGTLTNQQNSKAPDFKILITFFSPSGYEVRKDYEYADFVCYLPLDTPANARLFLDIVKPKMVFWVKYDFWLHFLTEIQQRQIPVILFSAVFRPHQIFFKGYGTIFRKILRGFTQIFVQNERSLQLLQSIHLNNVQIAGDTRFDRVWATAESPRRIEVAEKFRNNQKTLVIGSCWGRDLDVLIPFLNEFTHPLKVIIAPHEIKESTLQRIEKEAKRKSVRFSTANQTSQVSETCEVLTESEILLIDNVGMLAHLYQYADFAYIGGAFGEGLHNILEPAVFGIPVIFGKEYDKFPEAEASIQAGGAFSIQDTQGLHQIVEKLYQEDDYRKQCGQNCRNYIQANLGGAEKVVNYLRN